MSARSVRIAAVAAIAVTFAASVYALGCATEESIIFGDPICVAGRCKEVGTASSSSGGSDCNGGGAGGACPVSFSTDIFAAMLDIGGTAKCTDAKCHGDAATNGGETLLLKVGDTKGARTALLGYQMTKPDGPYITCAKPGDSKLLCNLFLGPGVPPTDYPHGKCGTLMPDLISEDVGAVPMTKEQLTTIEEWIACGAPDN